MTSYFSNVTVIRNNAGPCWPLRGGHRRMPRLPHCFPAVHGGWPARCFLCACGPEEGKDRGRKNYSKLCLEIRHAPKYRFRPPPRRVTFLRACRGGWIFAWSIHAKSRQYPEEGEENYGDKWRPTDHDHERAKWLPFFLPPSLSRSGFRRPPPPTA